jgi:hypothetical protein
MGTPTSSNVVFASSLTINADIQTKRATSPRKQNIIPSATDATRKTTGLLQPSRSTSSLVHARRRERYTTNPVVDIMLEYMCSSIALLGRNLEVRAKR